MKNKPIKPFLKWAGGKGQLITDITKHLPNNLSRGFNYFEPFLGSGAVFIFLSQRYNINKAFINEINPEVYLCFQSIKFFVDNVITKLAEYATAYKKMPIKRKEAFYYHIRNKYNRTRNRVDFSKPDKDTWPERTAMTIFLNKTCFNGLFRVNKNGDFNVPYGRYSNPAIFDERNLKEISRLLKNTKITNLDFEKALDSVNNNSFVYFDPPYRPLNKTACFTSYSINVFDDNEQARLANTIHRLTKRRIKVMMSNSDPKNSNMEDDFFDKLYPTNKFRHIRVKASRSINCNGAKRGKIFELLVTNYA